MPDNYLQHANPILCLKRKHSLMSFALICTDFASGVPSALYNTLQTVFSACSVLQPGVAVHL